jgi:hypothetical protein
MATALEYEFEQGGILSFGLNNNGQGHSIFIRSGEAGRVVIQITPLELKKLGELLVVAANKADDLEFDHPMGQS